jgi:hypothetical protein
VKRYCSVSHDHTQMALKVAWATRVAVQDGVWEEIGEAETGALGNGSRSRKKIDSLS